MSGPLVFLQPSAELAAFLLLAIRRHREVFARNGVAVPSDLQPMVDGLLAATGRQGPPSDAECSSGEQIEPIAPRLVSYDTAAAVMAISKRSLERQIAAGEIRPIRIGGSALIRLTDIDDFVARKAAEQGDQNEC